MTAGNWGGDGEWGVGWGWFLTGQAEPRRRRRRSLLPGKGRDIGDTRHSPGVCALCRHEGLGLCVCLRGKLSDQSVIVVQDTGEERLKKQRLLDQVVRACMCVCVCPFCSSFFFFLMWSCRAETVRYGGRVQTVLLY